MKRQTDPLVIACTFISVLCAVVVVVGGGSVLISNRKIASNNRNIGQNSHRIDLASLGACQRLQAQRERQNVSEARQFLILVRAGSNPKTPKPLRRSYLELAYTTQYAPPTNCPQAVADPIRYRAPQVVSFQLLGAGYALKLVHALERGQRQPTPSK